VFVTSGQLLLLVDVVAVQLAAEEVALIHGRGAAEEHQVVHEVGQRRRRPWPPQRPPTAGPVRARGNADGARGLPEVEPAPGEQARPHGVVGGQEGQDVVEDVVRERADEVLAVARHGRLVSICSCVSRSHCRRGEGVGSDRLDLRDSRVERNPDEKSGSAMMK